jgi:hypothetical protein
MASEDLVNGDASRPQSTLGRQRTRAARATFADDDILPGEAARIFELTYISCEEPDDGQ